jgi:hypothetical protein
MSRPDEGRRECCDEPDRRSDLPVIIGTTWRQINEAAADLRKSKQWD